MPSKIKAIDIDEFNSTIIVATEQNGIQVINTIFISEKDSEIKILSLQFVLLKMKIKN